MVVPSSCWTRTTTRIGRVPNSRLGAGWGRPKHPGTPLTDLLPPPPPKPREVSAIYQTSSPGLVSAHGRRCNGEALLLGRIVQQTHFEQDPSRRGLRFLNGNETSSYRLGWSFNGQTVPFRSYFPWTSSIPHMRHLAQRSQDTVCFGAGRVLELTVFKQGFMN